jgi:hypothetical protein
MNRDKYFDSTKNIRSREQWSVVLNELRNELSQYIGCSLTYTSEYIEEQNLSHASFEASIDVVVNINEATKIQYGGVICLAINYDEIVYINAYFLPFIEGKRLFSENNEKDILVINYVEEDGWCNPEWLIDGNDEWESYLDMDRWLNA